MRVSSLLRQLGLGKARVVPCAVCVSLAALPFGCSSGGSDPEHVAASRQEAVIAPFSATITLSAPQQLSPTGPLLEAANSIGIGPQAVIGGTTVAMGSGPGGVNAGPQVVMNDTWSRGGVNLGPLLQLTGTLHASTVTADPTAVVGAFDRTPVFDPVSTQSWNVTFPSTLGAAVHALNGQTISVVPGGYSGLSVDAGGTLTLHSGTYFLSALTVSSGAHVNLDQANGPVVVYVSNTISINATFKSLTAEPPNLLVGYLGTSTVTLGASGAPFNGALITPFAQLSLLTASAAHAGFFAARDISVAAAAKLQYVLPTAVVLVTNPPQPPAGPDPLPAPPTQPGCYIGSLKGWLPVPCKDPTQVFPGFTHLNVNHDGIGTVPFVSAGAAQPAIPLVYSQVEPTIESVGDEKDDSLKGAAWSIQNNSNPFSCFAGTAQCVAQFAALGDGVAGNSAACIETWQIPNVGGLAKAIVKNFCVAADGTTATGSLTMFAKTRVGKLQPGDFGNVAAYSFTSGAQAMMALVTQFSWVSSQDRVPSSEIDLPNRVPGLYAVVIPDTLGLAQGWTTATGGIIGEQGGSNATFTDASVLTRVAVSSCQGDTSAAGPTCPSLPAFTATNVQHAVANAFSTVESNNLTLTATPTVSLANQNLAVTSFLATTNVPAGSATATCLPGQESHLYLTDNEGDRGGVPSNVGGVPFWESPDIFVVPVNAAAPKISDTPADVQLTAGASYNVYLRVHNEFGCNDVTGPVSVFIDAADPNLGFANWQEVTAGAGQGHYTSFGAAGTLVARAFSAGIIGPFPWQPNDGGHKCLLAAIAASNETAPPASATAPVLPPAFSSNQIAQRNIQIGSSCSYSISNPNTTSANLTFGISVTPATPVPGANDGPAISLVIGDPGGVWAAAWTGVAGLSSVTNDGANTTLVLSSAYVALPSVPLAAGKSPTVGINITPVGNSPPTVNISALLVDPQTGDIVDTNGGSCTGTQRVIIVK